MKNHSYSQAQRLGIISSVIVAGGLLLAAPSIKPIGRAIAADVTALENDFFGIVQKLRLSDGANGAVAPAQLDRAVLQPASLGDQKPTANSELTRGAALTVYPKASPAIVFIQAGDGFGTGFIFDEDGWMLTNNHVVASAPVHIATGVRIVKVIRGHLSDGVMVADSTAQGAWVYKADERADLALLKFVKQPEEKLMTIRLADKAPPPGTDCIAIGHPRAGVLWTVRQGEIAGVAQWPKDSMNLVMAMLSSAGGTPAAKQRIAAALPQRKIILSSCGINPGDSGGPLLDAEGRLIAVTYGIPKNQGDAVNLDKFSYHVHLDEVKEFIKDRPSNPLPFVPDAWPAATVSQLKDIDGDGVPETLLFAVKKDQPPNGFQCDLTQKSSPKFDAAKLDDPEVRKLWQFQFALTSGALPRTFYDSKNTGEIDLILTDANRDNVADMMLRKEDNQWKAVTPSKEQKMVDERLFADTTLGDRFKKLLDNIKKELASAPKSDGKAAEGKEKS